MRNLFSTVLLFCLLQNCTRYDSQLEEILMRAGDNRNELSKVLVHYSDPRDSLKYRAAIFLMENMSYHSSLTLSQGIGIDYVFDSLQALDQYQNLTKDSLTNRAIRLQNFENIWRQVPAADLNFGNSDYRQENDIEVVKADFLINNIEYAFKAWELPWSRGYTFTEFCKYILPYRVGKEPLDEWRPYIFNQLQWIKDTLGNLEDPVKVCGYVNKMLQNTIYDERVGLTSPNGMKVSNIFKGKVWANCYDQTALGIAVMRTLGIAAAAGTIPNWGVRHGGHEFNAVLDLKRRWQYFSTGYLNTNEFYLDNRAPKIYLTKFFTDHGLVDIDAYRNSTKIDITQELLSVVNIELKGKRYLIDADVYLCTFDNKQWIPVCKGIRAKNKLKFSNMGRNMVYLPAILKRGKPVALGNPLIVYADGSVGFINPSKENVSFSFDRKYPILFPKVYEPRCQDLVGGRFQIADNINFIGAEDLLIIKNKPDLHVQKFKFPRRQGRFLRFIFPPMDYAFKSGPALISFYDFEGRKLMGKYIFSDGVTKANMDQIFDDNLLSHVKSIQYENAINFERADIILNKGDKDSLWVGLELPHEVSISEIEYCARNDKNGIYNGMRYELLYWNKSVWTSLGVRHSIGENVDFTNIPAGALLWLKNIDEGEDERIFVLSGKKVVWM